MTTATISVIVTDEASARIATLGLHQELKVMLQWVRTHVPDLQAIHVIAGTSRRPVLANVVFIMTYRSWDELHPPTDLVEWDFAGWKAQMFPPRVCSNVILSRTFQPLPLA